MRFYARPEKSGFFMSFVSQFFAIYIESISINAIISTGVNIMKWGDL